MIAKLTYTVSVCTYIDVQLLLLASSTSVLATTTTILLLGVILLLLLFDNECLTQDFGQSNIFQAQGHTLHDKFPS